MRKKIFSILFVAIIIFSCAPHFHFDFLGAGKMEEVVLQESTKKEKILVIDLIGVIESSSNANMLNRDGDLISGIYYRLKTAADDPLVKGIILRLNTPGGEVTASDIIYHEIFQFKKNTGIPVVALMMGVAASGGYYVASASDYIVAHPTTITGSIGVIGIMPDFSMVITRLGIKINVLKSGKMKDSGSPYKQMTSEEEKYFQSIVDKSYEGFLNTVYQSRKNKLSMERLKELADGRVYIGTVALELKLVDEIGYFETALQKVLSLAHIGDAKVVAYSYYPLKKTNIYARADSGENPFKLEIKGLEQLLPSLNPGIYYLWIPAMEK